MGTYEEDIQRKLNEAMPWIGLYIAAASAVCTLAMAADVINGFRKKKLWFPSKYFSLSATSLTLLAIAMKLPTDLNSFMLYEADWFAKINGLSFMSIAMGNFTSSLGSMNDKELLSNIVALTILVITIVVNCWIQIFQINRVINYYFDSDVLVPTILMLLLLATLVSVAVTVPTIKRSMELKYQEIHKLALREEDLLVNHTIDKETMMKYWVMAETSCPQFVMARSVMCTTSNLMCLFAAIILTIRYIRWFLLIQSVSLGRPGSVYGNVTKWILVIQFIGMAVGLIAPTVRLFIAISFRCSTTIPKLNTSPNSGGLETYWIQILLDLRDNFSYFQIQQHKFRKYLHNAKRLLLNFFIAVQIFIVLFNKLVLYFSVLFTTPFARIKNKLEMQFSSNVAISSDNQANLSRYVLLLEGELKLPKSILKNICQRADNMILVGKRKQPQNLIDLLLKFDDFSGVIEFDNTNEVPSLHSKEPPNCWALPLVTLTSIAIGLPNLAEYKRKDLANSVNEGLSLAKLVENTLDTNVELVNIRKSAEVSWVGVALYRKWQDVNLITTSRKYKNSKDMLHDLSTKAERTVMQFKQETKDDFLMENPVNWPLDVIASNSMYRVSQTILLAYKGEDEPTDEELFERLSIMIAGILMACLTNLPRVIITMSYRNAIEKRSRSVREAFILLGKTEQILQLLQQHEWRPSLDADKAAYIDEWRSLFQQQVNDSQAVSTLCPDETVETPISNADHAIVTIDC